MKLLRKPLQPNATLPWEATASVDAAAAGLPGVSIVMPVFNAGKFIEKTIRSLLFNDLSGCEIIFMDGGSTDETVEVARQYAHLFSKIVSEKDAGQSDAINKGFALSSKPILHWLNGDDILLPNAITRVREAFGREPSAHVIVGNAYMTEMDFTPIKHFKFSRETLTFRHLLDYARNHLVQPSVFFTRDAWTECGPVGKDLHYAMDADLFIGMAKKFELFPLDLDVAYSVYHEECKTRERRAESIVELALVQSAHGGADECRRTLGVLIAEFNQLKIQLDTGAPGAKRVEVLERRIRALESEQKKNTEVLMLADFPEQ